MLEQKVAKGSKNGKTPDGSALQRFEVLIDAYPPDRRKRDLDNILKPLLDVLQEYGIFPDDEQIDILIVRRRTKGGYVDVHVSVIEPEDSLTN